MENRSPNLSLHRQVPKPLSHPAVCSLVILHAMCIINIVGKRVLKRNPTKENVGHVMKTSYNFHRSFSFEKKTILLNSRKSRGQFHLIRSVQSSSVPRPMHVKSSMSLGILP